MQLATLLALILHQACRPFPVIHITFNTAIVRLMHPAAQKAASYRNVSVCCLPISCVLFLINISFHFCCCVYYLRCGYHILWLAWICDVVA